MSRLYLPLFSSELEMRTASLLLFPTPLVPSELNALVESTTKAINLCMKKALVPARLHRLLVPVWDNQLKERKKKKKTKTRGDKSTDKTPPLLPFLPKTTLASKRR